jgi:hypothetical protein
MTPYVLLIPTWLPDTPPVVAEVGFTTSHRAREGRAAVSQDLEKLEQPARVDSPVSAGRRLRAIAVAVGLGLAILSLRWWVWG